MSIGMWCVALRDVVYVEYEDGGGWGPGPPDEPFDLVRLNK